jgi:hypothetical protein
VDSPPPVVPVSNPLWFVLPNHIFSMNQVNLNYVFSSEGWKFRTAKDKPPDFGKMQDDVYDMLRLMAEAPHALYAVLGYFKEFKLMNKEVMQRHRAEKAEE